MLLVLINLYTLESLQEKAFSQKNIHTSACMCLCVVYSIKDNYSPLSSRVLVLMSSVCMLATLRNTHTHACAHMHTHTNTNILSSYIYSQCQRGRVLSRGLGPGVGSSFAKSQIAPSTGKRHNYLPRAPTAEYIGR